PLCELQTESAALAPVHNLHLPELPGSEPMVQRRPWTYRQLADAAIPLFYRFGAYVALTMLDDPAMLALAFC
ncbi:MAG: hypothetical protein KGN39_02390, partial [Betaproteobacteria bacterium]|nr:hypothetical protein [Betaproteobacteria bacterium]